MNERVKLFRVNIPIYFNAYKVLKWMETLTLNTRMAWQISVLSEAAARPKFQVSWVNVTAEVTLKFCYSRKEL